MRKVSAGILLYRRQEEHVEVMLVHPGGPFFAKRDNGWWSIPKGELDSEEEPLAAAKREFAEEVGSVPPGPLMPLGDIIQKSGKIVHAWAIEADFDVTTLKSNTVTIEWPPRSGRKLEVPEVDKAVYFTIEEAMQKINVAQIPLLERLQAALKV